MGQKVCGDVTATPGERQGGERDREGVRGSVSEGHISTLKLPVTREAKIRYV